MDAFPDEVSNWLCELLEAIIGVNNQTANETLTANSDAIVKVGCI